MHSCVKLLNAVEFGEAEEFRFQCAEETFDSSIIEAIAFSRHALCMTVFGNHYYDKEAFYTTNPDLNAIWIYFSCQAYRVRS